MTNKDNIIEKINIAKEILSIYPKNNENNIAEYLDKLEKEKAIYNQLNDRIIVELKNRYLNLSNVKPNEEVGILAKEALEKRLMLEKTNDLNSSFEKTKLDVILYNISKYYKGNLRTVNEYIKDAVEIFDKFAIKLNELDFAYSEFSKDYMAVFFKNIDNLDSKELNDAFERNYWKQPNIIKHIHISFRNLYYEKKEVFDKAIDLEISNNKVNFSNLLADYKKLVGNKELILSINAYHYLNMFQREDLKLADFEASKIKALYSKYVGSYDEINSNISISKLNDTIKEYKFYLEHKFIIDDIKKIILEDPKTIVSSKTKLKEINNKEESLLNSNKKGLFSKLFKKKELDLDEEALKISLMYNELDEIVFKERVREYITLESKIFDVLNIASSYYIYINRLLKAKDSKIDDEKIYNFYSELREFILSFDHTIINNLNAFDELDITMIISNKYKLDGLNISTSDLVETNLDNLIRETNILINYHNLNLSKEISLDKIDECLKIKKILNL